MRILLGEIEVAGYSKGLAAGLIEKGHQVYSLSNNTHPFGYQDNLISSQPKLISRFCAVMKQLNNPSQLSSFRFFILRFKKNFYGTIVLFWSLFVCDTYIFNFGVTLLPRQIDLLVLKVFRKTTIVNIGFGSDLRLPFINGTYLTSEDSHLPANENYIVSKVIEAKVKRIEKWAAVIVSCVNNCHLLSRPFLDFTHIGIPVLLPDENIKRESVDNDFDSLNILHAPSNSFSKGTETIERVINRLIEDGHNIRYVKMQGVANTEVMKHLAQCDLVVDQLYSDTPMATFASEASAVGVPCIVGGIGWGQLSKYFRKGINETTILIHPDELEEKLLECISSGREKLHERGLKAKSFVEANWNAATVSDYYLRIANNEIEEAEYFDPSKVIYSYGMGLNEGALKSNLKAIYEEYGEEGFVTKHQGQIRAFKKLIGV